MKEVEELSIRFQISDITNKCVRHIKKISDIIRLSYWEVNESVITQIKPLKVDNLPFDFKDPEMGQLSVSGIKNQAEEWLLKKALEEFIVAVTESLIDAHRFVYLYAFALENRKVFGTHAHKKYTKNAINTKLTKIDSDPEILPLPLLLNGIEKIIFYPIPFRKEIESINKVRNALVHRNGLVTRNEIQSKEIDLHLLQLSILVNKDGKWMPLTKELKDTPFIAGGAQLRSITTSVKFKSGTPIVITPDILNDVTYTCTQFAQSLREVIERATMSS